MNHLALTFIFIFILIVVSCRQKEEKLFEGLTSTATGINFINALKEDDRFNIIEYLYFYNGAGVSLGDVNNDGLTDIYLVSNQNENKLYINKGDFKFEDISPKAKVPGKGNWKTGSVMADVNGDGWLDIISCGVGNYKNFDGANQLYINQGDLTFKEQSLEYGLNFSGFSTHMAVFDYDLDGDLDLYLLNHSVHSVDSYGKASLRTVRDSLSGDRLYRNERIPQGIAKFTDATKEAGIYSSRLGYGLGVGISDLNRDGFPDIYISNDFHENDYLYLNNKNGTFQEVVKKATGHTSRFSMGNDLADFNNDLWPDIISVDMFPQSESVIKTSAGEDPYEIYQYKLQFGYHRQVSRNSLQLSRGIDELGIPVYSEIAAFSGVEATDWSWSPLLADLDGDGWKDLVITNGIKRRPNDLDYINFISSDSIQKKLIGGNPSLLPWISKMPEGRAPNYFFKNNGDLTFTDMTKTWVDSQSDFSNGSALGDLDNDGDPDLVVNRLDAEVLILKNTSNSRNRNRFVSVKLRDDQSLNRNGIGAKVLVYSGSLVQKQELYPSRGWSSSSDYKLLFGLGELNRVDSIVIIWPDRGRQKVELQSNQSEFEITYYGKGPITTEFIRSDNTLLKRSEGITFTHTENDFNAFTRENLMPLMATKEGPPVAVGDINGDALDDIFFGGAREQEGRFFIQSREGNFSAWNQHVMKDDMTSEDVDAAFADVDSDEDLDLIVVSGGHEELENGEYLFPRLYLNDGKGNYSKDINFLKISINASCVKPFDFDKDGDIDFFIGSDVTPLLYGMPPPSYLLVNTGFGKFENFSSWLGASQFDNVAKRRPGMVKDAIWCHVNDDTLVDLVLVGEWMPITILLQQTDHSFLNSTEGYGLAKTRGWWNVIEGADINKDGKIDFIVGNLGRNSRFHTSISPPLKMVLGDFDRNGSSDHIMVYNNNGIEVPYPSRDQLIRQLPHLRKKFLKYSAYKDARLNDILTEEEHRMSAQLTVDSFESIYLESKDERFAIRRLPSEAQFSTIESILIDDFNHDGKSDLLVGGNRTSVQPDQGVYDASIGQLLLGETDSTFTSVDSMISGFIVIGEIRRIVKVKKGTVNQIIVSRNNDSVLTFNVQ